MKTGLIALNGIVADIEALKKHCLYFAPDLDFQWVIGVDGGSKWLERLNIIPHQILGDMDSIALAQNWKSNWPSVEFVPFPPEKDYTDAELAIEVMKRRDVNQIVVIGALGGRADHMLGNVFLLKHGLQDLPIYLIDEQNRIEMVEGPVHFRIDAINQFGRYISFVPLSECIEGVDLKGFKYPLSNACIQFGQTIGISNERIESEAEVHIRAGVALVIYSIDI